MTMTPDWKDAAAHFGLSPEEAQAHWDAWQDLTRLRPAAFVDETFEELQTALAEAKRTGQPPDPATMRRLQARHDLIAAFTEDAAAQLNAERLTAYLQAYAAQNHSQRIH